MHFVARLLKPRRGHNNPKRKGEAGALLPRFALENLKKKSADRHLVDAFEDMSHARGAACIGLLQP